MARMSAGRRILGVVCIGSLAIAALAGVLVPEESWPLEWVRYRGYRGMFAGQPVRAVCPVSRQALVPLGYEIRMTRGVCRMSWIDATGQVVRRSSMGSGYVGRDSMPAGGQLELDPGSDPGRYVVEMGLKYHLLSPYLWRVLGGGMLVGLAAVGATSLFLRRRGALWLKGVGALLTRRQWLAVAALAVLSSAIFYPTVHEAGHALVGWALGGRVEGVVFTSISGQTPHVRFSYLPDSATPWMNAGGVFLPILAAYGLLLLWLTLGRRLSVFRQVLLLTPVVLFLFSGFGIDDHLRGMAEQLGCRGLGRILLVETIPAWLALAGYGAIGWRLWCWRRRTGGEVT